MQGSLSTMTRGLWRAQIAIFEFARFCRLDRVAARGSSSVANQIEHWLRMEMWRRLGPHAGTVVENRHGHYVLSDGRTPPSPRQVVGTHDREVSRWLVTYIRPGDTVVDVGANIGYFTVQAARRAGDTGRVIAFEPMPGNISLLRHNLELNDVRTVTLETAAVTAKMGPVSMYASTVGNARHSILHNADAGESVEVNGTTLDEWAATANVGWIDVLKIDVEGAELDVLDGAEETVANHRPVLIVEYWPQGLRRSGYDPGSLLTRLADLDYTVTVRHCGRDRVLTADSPVLTRLLQRNNGYVNLLAVPRPH